MPLRLLQADILKTVMAKLIGTSLRKVGTINHNTMKKPKNNHYLGYIFAPYPFDSGPGSVVRIATHYGMDGPGIESRWS